MRRAAAGKNESGQIHTRMYLVSLAEHRPGCLNLVSLLSYPAGGGRLAGLSKSGSMGREVLEVSGAWPSCPLETLLVLLPVVPLTTLTLCVSSLVSFPSLVSLLSGDFWPSSIVRTVCISVPVHCPLYLHCSLNPTCLAVLKR